MSDLRFEIQAEWNGIGSEGEGKLSVGKQILSYSAPENMGGKGVGASPEELLIAAVTSCYSGTLFGTLQKRKLPVRRVGVRAEGIVTGYPVQTKFARLIVHPTIEGGDKARRDEYVKAADTARDHCFIGKSIAGNIDYEIGEVRIFGGEGWPQEQIDELIERFYARLVKDPYYRQMFAERKVDIDLLKERQRKFIARLTNDEPSREQGNEVRQVRERHSFGIDPQRAATWLQYMRDTMTDMGLAAEVKDPLLAKMKFLIEKMSEKHPEHS